MRSRSLLWSFDYAIRGIVYALRTQRNMRLHIGAAVIVLVAALILRVTGLELVALLFAVGLVVVAELANTALEAAVDLATENFDPMAAVAKDVAAGAVLVASLTSVAVGYVIFIGRLAPVAQTAMDSARTTSTAVTLIAVVLTGVLVLVMKAVTHEPGTSFMHGGWPSGHTAIAFATAAAIGYSVDSAKAMILALFIALLVGQSRVESGTHTVPQAVAGAVLGFLLTTAAFQLFWK